jgi:predicted MFS family arabinose efflux permease
MAPLAGAGLFAALGMGRAYLVITACYCVGFLFTLGVGGRRRSTMALPVGAPRQSVWRELGDGFAYLWDTPSSLAAMLLALVVNLTAFPLTSGLLPYVAREIYGINQTGLGLLVASFALGALLGSVVISIASRLIRPARMMIVFALGWYVMLLLFARMPDASTGCVTLILAGFTQSMSLVPMAVMLLHGAGERFRGRVMGMRMLAIYGLPLGLLAAGALIERIGFVPTATAYCVVGMAMTLGIAIRWRAALWPLEAPGNAR